MCAIESAYDYNHSFAELSQEALVTGIKMTKKIIFKGEGLLDAQNSNDQEYRPCSVEHYLNELMSAARELINFNARPTTRSLFLQQPVMDDSLFYKLILDAREIVKARGHELRKLRLCAQRAISESVSEARSGAFESQLMIPEKLIDIALSGILTAANRQSHIWLGTNSVLNSST